MSRFITILSIIGIALIASVSVYLSRETLASFIFNASQTSSEASINDGLVGYWTFDGADVTATTVSDKSGNGNTGTRNNGISNTMGKIGQGMSFDGVDDYISVSDPGVSSLDLTDEVSFSIWTKLNSFSTDFLRLIAKENSGGAYAFITRSTGKLSVYFNGSTFDAPLASLITDVWQHHVVTYSKSKGKIKYYTDGVLLGSVNYGTSLGTNDLSLAIGARPYPSLFTDGKIDDVRIYNRALSADEIQQLYQMGESKFNKSLTNTNANINKGLVGYWTFDGADTTATTVSDKSGNSNTGTRNNGVSNTIGKIGQGMSFDGVDDYINTNTAIDDELLDGFTISSWVNFNSVAGTFVGNYESSLDDGFEFRISINQLYLIIFDHAPAVYIRRRGLTALSANQWYHVTATWDDSITQEGIKLYVDGVEESYELSDSGSFVSMRDSFNPITIGKYDFGGVGTDYLDGSMDDVRIYNRALSADEIQQLYQMGR